MRALASNQCSLGSILRLSVICRLSLLVLYSALRGFSFLVFHVCVSREIKHKNVVSNHLIQVKFPPYKDNEKLLLQASSH